MDPALTIIPAMPADAERVNRLFYEAAVWLEARGIRQWAAVWPPAERHQASIRERIARGWCYLAWRGGEVAGTLTLQPADPSVWGDDDGAALYVHGLAISRAWAGHGIGRAMLGWAEREVVACGRLWLRLDCIASNAALRAYYQRAGFRYVREIGGETTRRVALFEKLVAEQ